MVTLSAMISSEASASTRALTRIERDATRQALRRCITAGVNAGDLDPAVDIDGLVALYDGLVLGISIQARDCIPAETMRAAIRHAMAAWDLHRSAPSNYGK